MTLFGRWKAKQERRNIFLSEFQRGQKALPKDDFAALTRAFQTWPYIASTRNASVISSSTLRLYVGRKTSGKSTKAITTKQKDYLYSKSNLLQYISKAEDIEEVVSHPFLDLMKKVNPYMTRQDLFEMTGIWQDMTGNCYWYIVKNNIGMPIEIWILPAYKVKILPSEVEFIEAYIYEKSAVKMIKFEPGEIVHYKMPALKDIYYGMSPLQAVADAYNITVNMNKMTEALFANMGRPEGYWKAKEAVGDKEFKRIKQEIKQYRGASNAGKSPFVDSDIEFKAITTPPRELDYIEGRKTVKEEIINAFGQTMALYESSSNRATAEAATYLHMRDGIKPRLIRIEQKMNEKLMPMYDDKLFIAFDDPVPENQELRLKTIETHLKTGYSSPNEERQEDNIGEAEWGEYPIMPFGMSPYQGGVLPSRTEEDLGKRVMMLVEKKLKNQDLRLKTMGD